MISPNIELSAALDELQAALPQMIAANPLVGDFWDAFGVRSNRITDSARGSAAAVYAQGRLIAMLRDAGVMPVDYGLVSFSDHPRMSVGGGSR